MYYLKLVLTNAETLASDLQPFAEWKGNVKLKYAFRKNAKELVLL